MRTAVHTRRIIDPLAGVKLTGTSGRFTYGTLLAPDASVGPDAHKVFGVGRVVPAGGFCAGNGHGRIGARAGQQLRDLGMAADARRGFGGRSDAAGADL